MNNFFTTKDDFERIIKNTLGTIDTITPISTGWTNFVFKVAKENSNYIFRFPRNNFFANVLSKEVAFNQFIKGKITFPTTDLKLLFDNNRPYSMHKEIPGKSMSELYPNLNHLDKEKIANQIATFIYQLQNIDLSTLNIKLPLTSEFLTELSKVDNQKYDLSKLDPLIKLEQNKLTLSHADLNPGNILLDDNYNVCGILDFAFVSLTTPLNDMARLIGRLPKDFYNIMIDEYNKVFNIATNTNDIDTIIKVWNHVEYHYMIYMKNNHPEIVF